LIYLHLFFVVVVVVLFLINEWEGTRFVFYGGWIWSHLRFSYTLRYVLMEVFVKDIGVVWNCFVQVVFEPPNHHYDCLRYGFVCVTKPPLLIALVICFCLLSGFGSQMLDSIFMELLTVFVICF